MNPPPRETILSRPRLRDDGLVVFEDNDGAERLLLFEIALQAMQGHASLEVYDTLGRTLPLTRYLCIDQLADPDRQPGARVALDWLLAHGTRHGDALLWRHEFDLHQPAAGTLSAPWPSAFSQAFILLALLLWRKHHPDRIACDLVRAACRPFLDDGLGLVTKEPPDGIWFQEYPFHRPTYVLNAHLLALVALSRADEVLNEDTLRRRFQAGVRALVSKYDLFDRGIWSRYDLQSQGHLTLRLETPPGGPRVLIRSVRLFTGGGTLLAEDHARDFFESTSYLGPFQGADWHLASGCDEPLLELPPDRPRGTMLHYAGLQASFDDLREGLMVELQTKGSSRLLAQPFDPRCETLSFLAEWIPAEVRDDRAVLTIPWRHIGPPLPFHYQLFHAQTARELVRRADDPRLRDLARQLESHLLQVPAAMETLARQYIESGFRLKSSLAEEQTRRVELEMRAANSRGELAVERRLNADLLQRLIRQEARTARLSNQLVEATTQLDLRSGIRGGAKEFLRGLKRKIAGSRPETPRLDFDLPWRSLDPPVAPAGASLRVLVFSHMFPHPDQPASGPFILEQVKALRRDAGVDARVVVGRPFWMTSRNPMSRWRAEHVYRRFHRDSQRWFELDSVPVCYLPFRILGPWFTQGWTYRAAMLRALPWIRSDFDFDLVHAHTGYLDGAAGTAVSRRAGVPLVITEHTGPFTILMKNPIVRRWTLHALACADRVITVSQAQRRAVAEYLPPALHDRIIVLPNVVDTARFTPPPRWTPDPRAPRLLFVGYFVPIKQLPLLLDAFQLLLQRIPGASLQLVGGGENREQEEQLDAEIARRKLHTRIACRGHQDREEIARTLREDCDVLVLCSRSETFGCVVIEALACGKPVVATRCGGPEDILTSDELGALCENNNAQALADALHEVIVKLPTLSPDAIRRHAEEHYGHAAVAGRIVSLYRELVPRPITRAVASAAIA